MANRLTWLEPWGAPRVWPVLVAAYPATIGSAAWFWWLDRTHRSPSPAMLVFGGAAFLALIFVPLLARRSVRIDDGGIVLRGLRGMGPPRTIPFASVAHATLARSPLSSRLFALGLYASGSGERAPSKLARLALFSIGIPETAIALLAAHGVPTAISERDRAPHAGDRRGAYVWQAVLAGAAFLAIGVYRVFFADASCPDAAASLKFCTEPARAFLPGVAVRATDRDGAIAIEETGLRPPFDVLGAGDAQVAFAAATLEKTQLGSDRWRIAVRVAPATNADGLRLEGIDANGNARIAAVTFDR